MFDNRTWMPQASLRLDGETPRLGRNVWRTRLYTCPLLRFFVPATFFQAPTRRTLEQKVAVGAGLNNMQSRMSLTMFLMDLRTSTAVELLSLYFSLSFDSFGFRDRNTFLGHEGRVPLLWPFANGDPSQGLGLSGRARLRPLPLLPSLAPFPFLTVTCF